MNVGRHSSTFSFAIALIACTGMPGCSAEGSGGPGVDAGATTGSGTNAATSGAEAGAGTAGNADAASGLEHDANAPTADAAGAGDVSEEDGAADGGAADGGGGTTSGVDGGSGGGPVGPPPRDTPFNRCTACLSSTTVASCPSCAGLMDDPSAETFPLQDCLKPCALDECTNENNGPCVGVGDTCRSCVFDMTYRSKGKDCAPNDLSCLVAGARNYCQGDLIGCPADPPDDGGATQDCKDCVEYATGENAACSWGDDASTSPTFVQTCMHDLGGSYSDCVQNCLSRQCFVPCYAQVIPSPNTVPVTCVGFQRTYFNCGWDISLASDTSQPAHFLETFVNSFDEVDQQPALPLPPVNCNPDDEPCTSWSDDLYTTNLSSRIDGPGVSANGTVLVSVDPVVRDTDPMIGGGSGLCQGFACGGASEYRIDRYRSTTFEVHAQLHVESDARGNSVSAWVGPIGSTLRLCYRWPDVNAVRFDIYCDDLLSQFMGDSSYAGSARTPLRDLCNHVVSGMGTVDWAPHGASMLITDYQVTSGPTSQFASHRFCLPDSTTPVDMLLSAQSGGYASSEFMGAGKADLDFTLTVTATPLDL